LCILGIWARTVTTCASELAKHPLRAGLWACIKPADVLHWAICATPHIKALAIYGDSDFGAPTILCRIDRTLIRPAAAGSFEFQVNGINFLSSATSNGPSARQGRVKSTDRQATELYHQKFTKPLLLRVHIPETAAQARIEEDIAFAGRADCSKCISIESKSLGRGIIWTVKPLFKHTHSTAQLFYLQKGGCFTKVYTLNTSHIDTHFTHI